MPSILDRNENSEKRYYDGWINKAFRIYFYFGAGLNEIGALKTIAFFLIGFGLILKIESTQYTKLALVGLILSPVIALFGYVMATRGNRSREYNNMRNLSPIGRYGLEMQEKQIEQQAKIIELLEKIAKHD